MLESPSGEDRDALELLQAVDGAPELSASLLAI